MSSTVAKRKRKQHVAIDKGTPETRRRLREPTLTRLQRTGALTPDMERAALEIDRMFSAVTRGLGSKVASLELASKSASSDCPPHLLNGYLDRYLPWTREAPADQVDVVLDVIVFDKSLAELDKQRNKRNGTCQKLLIEGLKRYALIAHWG